MPSKGRKIEPSHQLLEQVFILIEQIIDVLFNLDPDFLLDLDIQVNDNRILWRLDRDFGLAS